MAQSLNLIIEKYTKEIKMKYMLKPVFPEIVNAIFWTGENLQEVRSLLDMDNKDAHYTIFMNQRLMAMKNVWIVCRAGVKMPYMLKTEVFEEYFLPFKSKVTVHKSEDKEEKLFF